MTAAKAKIDDVVQTHITALKDAKLKAILTKLAHSAADEGIEPSKVFAAWIKICQAKHSDQAVQSASAEMLGKPVVAPAAKAAAAPAPAAESGPSDDDDDDDDEEDEDDTPKRRTRKK